MRRTVTLRTLASGIVWAALYNAGWAVAWLVFMRREWQAAFDAVSRPMAWTQEVWLIWIILTVPLGTVVMVYTESAQRRFVAAVRAGGALFVPLVLGMTIWGLSESHPLHVLALDALVNLFVIPLASLGAAATLARKSVADIGCIHDGAMLTKG